MKIKRPGKRLCSLLLACAVLLSGVLGAAAPVLRAQALAPDEIDSFLDALSEQVPMMVFLESNPEGNLTYNCDYANEIVHEALYADFTPRSEVQFAYATQGDESRNSGFSLSGCWLGRYAPMVGLYGDSYSPDLSMTQSTITSWYSFGDVTSFCIPFTQSKLLSYELYVNAPDPSHRRTLPFRGYTLIVAPDANGNARSTAALLDTESGANDVTQYAYNLYRSIQRFSEDLFKRYLSNYSAFIIDGDYEPIWVARQAMQAFTPPEPSSPSYNEDLQTYNEKMHTCELFAVEYQYVFGALNTAAREAAWCMRPGATEADLRRAEDMAATAMDAADERVIYWDTFFFGSTGSSFPTPCSAQFVGVSCREKNHFRDYKVNWEWSLGMIDGEENPAELPFEYILVLGSRYYNAPSLLPEPICTADVVRPGWIISALGDDAHLESTARYNMPLLVESEGHYTLSPVGLEENYGWRTNQITWGNAMAGYVYLEPGFQTSVSAVSFDPNGGTWTQDGSAAEKTDSGYYIGPISLPAGDAITRPGYTLIGWTGNVTFDHQPLSFVGCHASYYPNQFFCSENVPPYGEADRLQAVWAQNCQVTLDPGGGVWTDGDTQSKTIVQYDGSEYTLPTDLARSGYAFAGWSLPADSTAALNGNTLTCGSTDVTLTAQWTQIQPQDKISVTIGDQIGVNLLLDLDARNAQNVTVVYKDLNGDEQRETFTDFASLPQVEGGLYKIRVDIAPAQIADTVTVYIDGETLSASVKNYCNTLTAGDYEPEVVALAQAVLDYGQAANNFFDYTDETISAVTNLSADDAKAWAPVFADTTGKIRSISFMALTKPEFRFYTRDITEAEAAAYNTAGVTAAYADTSITETLNARFVKNQSGDILIEVTGVMAEYMDETIIVTIDGLGTITFAGNDFAKLMANNAATEALGAALYAYGAAAKACFRPELNTVDGDMEVPVPTPGGNTP